MSLFMGNDDDVVKAKRADLRAKIKANLAAAVAAGVDLEGEFLCMNFCWT